MPIFRLTAILPIVMLVFSNVFMTFAWYGHLRHKTEAMWLAVISSWGIAFFEYCLAVPANRIGVATYSVAQLKTIQEVITLTVFALFSTYVLRQPLGWQQFVGFGLIVVGAAFIFQGRV